MSTYRLSAIRTYMKAIVFTRYGSPDGLEFKEVPKPQPKDGEVLVRIRASSINSWDWEYLNGVPFINRLVFGLFKPKPGKQRLGADIAGTVEGVGKNVTRFQIGDEVFGDLSDRWGGFAEFAAAPEDSLEPKPVNLTFEQAATVPQAGVLALNGIRKAEDLQPGQKVLINGAGGGAGTFGIQLAKLAGAEVTGVDAKHKHDAMLAIGADHVLDHKQVDFAETGQRYDLVVDCQNTRSMFEIKRALEPGGTYAMIGGSMGWALQLLILNLFEFLDRNGKKLRLVAEGPNKGLWHLKELIEAEDLVPVIDRTFKLHQVPEALRYFGSGQHKGKISITMDI